MFEKTIVVVATVLTIFGITLLIAFPIWCLWGWVVPNLFPDANEAWTQPSFLVFYGTAVLINFALKFLGK